MPKRIADIIVAGTLGATDQPVLSIDDQLELRGLSELHTRPELHSVFSAAALNSPPEPQSSSQLLGR